MATAARPRLPAAVHLVRAGTVLVAAGGVAAVWWAATYQVPGGVCPAITPPPFGCWPPRIGAGWAWTAVLVAAAALAVVLPGRVVSGRTAVAGVAALTVAALCCVAVASLVLPPPLVR